LKLRNLRKSFAIFAAFLMVFANASMSFATTSPSGSTSQQVGKASFLNFQKSMHAENGTNDLHNFKASDQVRVIVELEGEAAINYATKQGTHYKDLSPSKKEMLTQQALDEQSIVKNAIASKNIAMSYKNSFTTVFNGFSGEVAYGDIEKIEMLSNVKRVYLANEYNRPEQPNMDTSHQFIQSTETWQDAGYKGEGTVIAIIDTGIDPSHRDMVLSPETEVALSEDGVNDLIATEGLKGQYHTAKVPYGYNYFDHNQIILDLGPDASMHGMHVAGTAGANGDVENGGIKGVAPESQLLAMKVFSNDPLYPSTWTDIYLEAIDESIALGADVINMSLGSTASFYEPEDVANLAITRAVENGIVAAISAGNSDRQGSGFTYNNGHDYPYAQNPDIGVVGAPGLSYDSLQVAASGNIEYLYQHEITLDGNMDFSAVGYGADDWTSLQGPLELVHVPGVGYDEDFAQVDVAGKVAVVSRGAISFYAKTQSAAAAGAIAIIVYNNGGSVFYENQGGWDVPFMKIDTAEGEALVAAMDAGFTTLNVNQLVEYASPESGKMTSFTSWGTTPSLELKPEITAPGGKIYSTLNNDSYGLMSGTSMAAPHVAGGSALVMQAIKENHPELTPEQQSRLAKKLLMNTASIILDDYSMPFSPRRQGAGMMQTYSAVNTPVYVVSKDTNEAKVELKDFTEKVFSFTLTAHNMSDADIEYTIDTSVLTDALQTYNGKQLNLLGTEDIAGAEVIAVDSIIVPANGSEEFEITIDLTNASLMDYGLGPIELKEDIFIEGFVTLVDVDGEAPDLSVPYVGFYGEWDRPEILDGWEELEELEFYHWSNTFDDGTYVLPFVDGNFVLSPNADGIFDQAIPMISFMRNAKEVSYNVLDADGNLLRRVKMENNVRKDYFDGTYGPWYSYVTDAAWDGTVKNELVEDGLYYYEFKSVIDYAGADYQSKTIPVLVDTTAPVVENVTYNDETGDVTWTTTEDGSGVLGYEIYVDGEFVGEAAADATSYQVENPLSNVLVEVVAYDNAMNVGSATGLDDGEYPVIYINSPSPWTFSSESEVAVSGYVTDNWDVVSIVVNGDEVEYTLDEETGEYHFDTTVMYEEDGKHFIYVDATDIGGNTMQLSRMVYVDTTAPTLEVTVPYIVGSDVTSTDLEIAVGDNYEELRLFIDGSHEYTNEMNAPYDMRSFNDTMTYNVSLEEGDNSFTLELVDIAGNTTVKEVTIYRATEEESTFLDNSHAWADEEVNFLSQLGVIKGYEDGNFNGENSVSRLEAAIMLTRALGLDTTNVTDPGFNDVDTDHEFYAEIAAAANAGIFAGDLEGNFNGNNDLTRGEMAKVMVNAFNLTGEYEGTFTDVNADNPHYFMSEIYVLAANEITRGYTDGRFAPDETLSRTHFSVFVARAMHEHFRNN
jgi:lactocepin